MATATGLITVNGKQILEVDDDPSTGLGLAAPLGSIASYDSGTVGSVYIKTGSADTAWQRIDVPEGQDWQLDGNELTGTEFFGSTNDQDVPFRRNNTELARLVADGLLVGLNSTLGGRLQVGAASLGSIVTTLSSPNGGSGARVIHVTRQYKVQTTNGTLTTLADVAVPTDSVVGLTLKVVARQHGGTSGAAGDGAFYIRNIHARNVGGTVAVRQTETSVTSEDVNQWNLAISASGANVRAQVQGGADRNVAWFSHAELLIAVD